MANNQLLASDNFASGSLAAGWSLAQGCVAECAVTSAPHYAEPTALNTVCGQVWTGLTWPNDQISEVTIQNLTAPTNTSIIVLVIRWQTGAQSGYQLNISAANGATPTIVLNRTTAGATTQLGSTVTQAISAGDVITLSAGGANISVYYNGTRIIYAGDATYTSGNPGFQCYAQSGAVTQAQVAAWRGYSYQQQDGIWTKKQIIIPALSGDLSGTQGTFIPTQILHEGNAQLLSGVVYKMWFSAGGSGNPGIYYAESTDGINWTRNAATTPVIAGQFGPAVIKVGSTYYLYTQPSAAFGTGDFALYTSTDGIHWSSVSSTILALGTAGQWDSATMFTFAPVTIINGTWYALYSATNAITPAATAYIGKTGLATSSDGINWTKYAGNPVLNGWVTQATVNVNGVWYTWIQECQLGQGNAVAAGLDPTETVRYRSPDLINWTKSAQSIHHSQFTEGVNTNTGQSFINSIIDIGGVAYAYLNSDPNDSASPQIYQISLATAPAATASIVQVGEDAVVQTSSDNFTRANGSLGANWATPTGTTGLQIASNKCEPSALTTHCGQYFVGAFSPNQYSEITLSNLTGNGFGYATVRVQPGAMSWYEISFHSASGAGNAGTLGIFKMVAGVETAIGSAVVMVPSLGDVLRLQVITGSDGFPVLSAFQNGFLLVQVEDYSSTFTTGNPGISAYSGSVLTDVQYSLWAGGNASVMPNFPSIGGSWLQANRDFANKRGIRGN